LPPLCFCSPGAPAAEEDSLKKFLQDYLGEKSASGRQPSRYARAFVDLDGDGRNEVVVHVMGSLWCGSGGCTTLILASKGASYDVISKITVNRAPIRLLETRSQGWHSIAVEVRGGEAELRFDGKSYPGNPTVPPARPLPKGAPGRVLIDESDQGIALFP
jgi:hypothetical protein